MKRYIRIKIKILNILLVVFILSLSASVYAASVPNTFTSGTTAVASEVNANFSYLSDRSWELSGSILYYSAGNVGIGTDIPDHGLHISGIDDAIHIEGTLGVNNHGGRLTFGDAGFAYIEETADDALTIYASEVIFDAPVTGFGTTTPSYQIDTGAGAYLSNGGVWTDASSREYKENIQLLSTDKAMQTLKELDPVEFNYKVDKNDQYVGFIAEDVPELVATKDRKGLSSMDIVAVLTKVVQQQQKSISNLARKVDELDRELKLKNQLVSVSNNVN